MSGHGFQHAIVCSFHDCSGVAVLPNGKTAHWDFSRDFGPLFTDAAGKELDPQPGTRTYAWKAFELWLHELNGEEICRLCNGTGRGEPFFGTRHFWACKGGCDEGWVKRVQTSAEVLPTGPRDSAAGLFPEVPK